jgi:Beta-galactosidase/beta-glucuronidase
MNMLRIWGGGMFMPRSFYEACDKLGVLLYHDLMFVEEQYHSAEKTNDVEEEMRFTIRTLLTHPSIILWNSCNECSRSQNISSDIYSQFVLPLVAQEDGTRPIWGSSPSFGFSTGVFGIDGIPNGNNLTYTTQTNVNKVEIHGPYNHGASKTLSTVNGQWSNSSYNTLTPFHLNRHEIGLSYPNHFVSEFGASVFSSFESMHAVISRKNWGLHGDTREKSNCTTVYENANECFGTNVLSQRNYPCDNHIEAYFTKVNLSITGEEAFRSQLYKCMISQMLWMKGTIEVFRSQNSYGTLIWQLNDNWPTGSWGLVEYGSHENEKGQVLGGRWKPLMHLLKRSLFRDVFASCGMGCNDEYNLGKCFVRNNGNVQFTGMVIANVWFFSGELHSRQSFHFTSLEPHDSIGESRICIYFFLYLCESLRPYCTYLFYLLIIRIFQSRAG